jgi:hypothetical protein
MPRRSRRPKKNQNWIVPLYTRPVLKFLRRNEPWEPIADLIFGPSTSRPSREEIEKLKQLWAELRADILAAQAQYAPGKKPWGCRFER